MQPVTFRFSKSPPLLDVLSLASLAMFIFPLLMAAGIGLRWLKVPGTGWIKTLGPEAIAYFWVFLGLAVLLGVLFFLTLAWKSPARNFVQLDDVGLTYAFLGLNRRWPWRAVASADLEQTGVPVRAAKLTLSGRFAWIDRLGLLFLNTLASSTRATLRLPDFYESPIEEIVAKINDYRALALGERPAAADARRANEKELAAAEQPVTYARSNRMYRLVCTIEYSTYAIVMVLIGAAAYVIHIDEDRSWNELFPPGFSILGVTLLMLVVSAAVQKRAVKPKHNNLRLDKDGLTYTRAGKALRWSWGEVSNFTFHLATSRRLLGRRRFITFAAPGRDWTWRWLRRYYGLPKHPPLVLIEDIYETPLAEIADSLNAFREQALGRTAPPAATGMPLE